MKFKQAVTYDDMLLVPQYSNIESRSEVDLSNDLSAHVTLDLPILSAPMDTVCEGEMAIAMARNGGMGVIHRYNSIDEQFNQFFINAMDDQYSDDPTSAPWLRAAAAFAFAAGLI